MISSDDIKKNISKNITKYRENAGFSHRELAQQLGITPSRISNWEQGANCPTIDILFEVCRALHVSINDIYGVYPDSEMRLSYSEQQHIHKDRSLDDHGRETVDLILEREVIRSEMIRSEVNRIKEEQKKEARICEPEKKNL